MPPNVLPIVATGRENAAAKAEAATTAISMPGQLGRNLRSKRMVPTVIAETATADALSVGSARTSAASLGSSSPGSSPASSSPKRALIWLANMMTAIPAVKPTVTG